MLEVLLITFGAETVTGVAVAIGAFIRRKCRHQKEQKMEKGNQNECCCICGDSNAELIPCNNQEQEDCHHFCHDCLNLYAKTAFSFGGDYEKTLVSLQEDRNLSEPGQLPCPFFGCADCNRHEAFPEEVLRKVLSNETFGLWMDAVGRVAIQKARAEAERVAALQEEQRSSTPGIDVEDIKIAVEEALSMGAKMTCPECGNHGEKDDACMHISCEVCGTDWCYCCGHPQSSSDEDGVDVCPSCDRDDCFLESMEGWDDFADDDNDETPGYGALHEFHRRRMAYFVQQIKNAVDSDVWEAFELAYPDILEDTPTPNRCIRWDEIDDAEPPMFGDAAHPEDLRWIHNMDDMVHKLRKLAGDEEEPAVDETTMTPAVEPAAAPEEPQEPQQEEPAAAVPQPVEEPTPAEELQAPPQPEEPAAQPAQEPVVTPPIEEALPQAPEEPPAQIPEAEPQTPESATTAEEAPLSEQAPQEPPQIPQPQQEPETHANEQASPETTNEPQQIPEVDEPQVPSSREPQPAEPATLADETTTPAAQQETQEEPSVDQAEEKPPAIEETVAPNDEQARQHQEVAVPTPQHLIPQQQSPPMMIQAN